MRGTKHKAKTTLPRRRCGKKVRYHDRLAAVIALSRIIAQDRDGHDERRAYECPSCNGWHLTSKRKAGA